MGAAADKLQCISVLWNGEILVSYFTQQTGCYEHPKWDNQTEKYFLIYTTFFS